MIKELYSYQFFSRIVTVNMTYRYMYAVYMQHVPSDSNKKKRMAYLHVCTTVSPYLSTSKGKSSV